jgi:hypothetical protein
MLVTRTRLIRDKKRNRDGTADKSSSGSIHDARPLSRLGNSHLKSRAGKRHLDPVHLRLRSADAAGPVRVCRKGAHSRRAVGRDPGEIYQELTRVFGEPVYDRVEAPATPEQKKTLESLSAQQVRSTELAGEAIHTILTSAPGNGEPIGGLKVVAEVDGSRRVRRGPRISIKSTRRAFAERIICGASWRKRRPSSARLWRRGRSK